MTQAEQLDHWKKFNSFQQKIERKFIPLVKKPMTEAVDAFIKAGMPAAQINDYIKVVSPLTGVINNLYYQCAYGWGWNTYKQYRNVKKTSPDDIATMVINALRFSLMTNVQGIEASIKNAILGAIYNGQINGWSFDETADIVKGLVGVVRARRIVRTESVKAANLSSIEGAKRTGLLMDKQWVSARDKRVRGNPNGLYPKAQFDHWDMNQQTTGINETFTLPSRSKGTDELQFPGDPSGNPADIINCRCVCAFIPKRDSNGRVIRETPQPGAMLMIQN